jgi:hypothetical protein
MPLPFTKREERQREKKEVGLYFISWGQLNFYCHFVLTYLAEVSAARQHYPAAHPSYHPIK